MINEGFKNKPLDRYPYMENDLKNSIVTPEDYTKLKKLLPEAIVYDDFIIPEIEFTEKDPFGFIALKSGGYIYALIGGGFIEDISAHSLKKIAHININKYPELKPKIRGIISSPYFTGNVLTNNGAINIYNCSDIPQNYFKATIVYPIEI